MPRYLPEPPWQHGQADSIAVVLVNLGSPDAPTTSAVRRYLREFLSDPRVVEIPRPLWWLILNGLILPTRPAESAKKYASIWTEQGSPLVAHSREQARLLGAELARRGHARVRTALAMRYGQPALPAVLQQLKAEGCQRILLLPLYPQYAASTTATVVDAAGQWLSQSRHQPEMRIIKHYHDHPGYIAALAACVRRHWATHGEPGPGYRLIMSFHGIPRRSLDLGDPYHCECHKTARLLATALELPESAWQLTFQSRFGKAAWLQPYTAPTLAALPAENIERVDVICPGFPCDCLETLEEIAMEAREIFIEAGGKQFHYIPALNADPLWIDALADLAETHLAGWPSDHLADAAAQQQSAARARALGGS